MNEGAGVHRPRHRRKSHAKCDVDAGIVGQLGICGQEICFCPFCHNAPPEINLSIRIPPCNPLDTLPFIQLLWLIASLSPPFLNDQSGIMYEDDRIALSRADST